MEGGLRSVVSTPWRKVVLGLILGQVAVIAVVMEYNRQDSVVKRFSNMAVVSMATSNRSKFAQGGFSILRDPHQVTDTSRETLPPVDVHKEDPVLGHIWDASDAHHQQTAPDLPATTPSSNTSGAAKPGIDPQTVAIGMGLTSRGVKNLSNSNLHQTMSFFTTLLPSFCNTCSLRYKYHFFIAFDYNDPFLTKDDFLQAFSDKFTSYTQANCPKGSEYRIHYVQCSHSKSPAWAQNDAMMEAYLSNMAFYYRINDDTVMKTPGWTETFIQKLSQMDPPYVGVVGPHHRGGNMAILTYDFVAHYHVDIFGFYYPRKFPDWYADRWITDVYKPGRTMKLPDVRLDHTMKQGQRYRQHRITREVVNAQIASDKLTLLRYIEAYNEAKQGITKPSNPKYVISLSVYGKNPNVTYGAVRNTLLQHVYLPQWSTRVYISKSKPEYIVPPLILQKLYLLGADIREVPSDIATLPPSVWRYLAADDPNVDAFLVRDTQGRLSDREASAVNAWLSQEASSPSFHCLRDHLDHRGRGVVDGLWGGRNTGLRHLLGASMESLLVDYHKLTQSGEGFRTQGFLDEVLWPRVKNASMCHDSVSCQAWPGAKPFPVLRQNQEYLGAHYDITGRIQVTPKVTLPGSAPDTCNTQR